MQPKTYGARTPRQRVCHRHHRGQAHYAALQHGLTLARKFVADTIQGQPRFLFAFDVIERPQEALASRPFGDPRQAFERSVDSVQRRSSVIELFEHGRRTHSSPRRIAPIVPAHDSHRGSVRRALASFLPPKERYSHMAPEAVTTASSDPIEGRQARQIGWPRARSSDTDAP